ncbi:MAG: FAD-dependent oxidoreductase [Alphaproteobacteria bacterium]|nr:FAD-dependent oxidoreductase [Alphaproteobacteria bacterium]
MAEQVTIIGAGIVGICSAIYLLEKGFAVEVIDRDPPAEGASHGNAGVVSPWTCVPQSMPGLWRNVPRWLLDPEGPVALRWPYLPSFLPWAVKFLRAGDAAGLPAIADAMNALNRPNLELYRQLLKNTGAEHLISDSCYVHVYRDPAAIDLRQLAWRLRLDRDVPLEAIDDGTLHEIEPALSADYKAAVLIKAQGRALDPGGVGKALAAKAQAAGARFRQVGVDRIAPREGGGWRLGTAGGEIDCGKLVVAAGAWSARLLAPLGLKLPLEAERGYHLVLGNPGITVNNSIMDTESKFVASSMLAGVRCAGTAEFAGLDAAPDYRRAKVFKRLAKRLFPDINTDDTVEWMGSRPSFPDSLPCIGEVPGQRDLFAAFGHSHYGFGMAPNTGRIVAGVVAGETPNVDLAPYGMGRFS